MKKGLGTILARMRRKKQKTAPQHAERFDQSSFSSSLFLPYRSDIPDAMMMQPIFGIFAAMHPPLRQGAGSAAQVLPAAPLSGKRPVFHNGFAPQKHPFDRSGDPRARLLPGKLSDSRQKAEASHAAALLRAVGVMEFFSQHLEAAAHAKDHSSPVMRLEDRGLHAALSQPSEVPHRVLGAGQDDQIR